MNPRAWLRRLTKKGVTPSVALMYHRVANAPCDAWQLAVSPQHFEQQLQVLRKTGRVRPLSFFLERQNAATWNEPFILITFDDGYSDNYHVAKPLLEQYDLPATFFVATRYLDEAVPFWWDELAFVLLEAPLLPAQMVVTVHGEPHTFHLHGEESLTEPMHAAHRAWNAYLEPPSKRARTYLQLWEKLSPLSFDEQQAAMAQVRSCWAPGTEASAALSAMHTRELQQLAAGSLFSIGAHTHSHPLLPAQAPEVQQVEISLNCQRLAALTGAAPQAIAYPSGRYDVHTLEAARLSGLEAGFTTQHEPLLPFTDRLQLGRYQVNNWNARRFETWLQRL